MTESRPVSESGPALTMPPATTAAGRPRTGRLLGAIVPLSLSLLAACSRGPTVRVTPVKGERTAAAAKTSEADSFTPWVKRSSDEIAPGNQIELKGADDPKINGVFTVGADGSVRLPYDVKLQAKGKNVSAFTSEVQNAYRQYLTSPKIRVGIVKREVYVDVRGLVQKPGQYVVEPASSLDAVLAQAGGVVQSSGATNAANYVRIDQLGVTNVIRLRDYYAGREDKVPEWQGGETVFVQPETDAAYRPSKASRNYVQIIGQVKQPGEYPVIPDGDFYTYLVRAGGETDRADLYNMQLVREIGDKRELITFTIDQVDELPPIRAGDVIMVRADNPAPIEKTSRVVSGFTSIIATIATLALLFTTT